MTMKLIFNLSEPKKYSGKYVQEGTEEDQWPTMMYLKRDWFPTKDLPKKVELTVTPITDTKEN